MEILEGINTLITEVDEIQRSAAGTFDRETASLEKIREAIDAVSLGGGTASSTNQELIKDGNAADFVATEDSLHDIRSAVGRSIITGAANRRLEDTPYFTGNSLALINTPTVDQPSMNIAYQSLANSNGALPTTAEITPGTCSIDRFRDGTDADWVNIVNASALTEANGLVTFSYTFPNASWQIGDLARVSFAGTSVVLGGKTVTIPSEFGFTYVGGIAIADSTLNLLPEHVVGNKADAASTTVNTTTSVVAYIKGLLNRVNDATFGLSALETLTQTLQDATGAEYDRTTDSLQVIRDFLTTMNATIDTINTSVGGGAGTDLDDLIALHAVPAQNSSDNLNVRDVVGNKSDLIITDATAFTNTSLARKMLTLQRAWKAVVPDIEVNLAAVDNVLSVAPSGANTPDAANTVLSLNAVAGSSFRLDSLILFVSSFGTGTFCDLRLYLPVNGVVTLVKTVRVGSALSGTVDFINTEYLNLADLFGVTTVTADTMHVIAIVDSGNTGALQANYSYSVARVS